MKKRNLGKDHGTVPGLHMVQAIVLTSQARQGYSQGSLRSTLKEGCALLLGLISLRVTYLKKKNHKTQIQRNQTVHKSLNSIPEQNSRRFIGRPK